jgi:methylated-DNA-protein-cysteine methyltransferase-like protein
MASDFARRVQQIVCAVPRGRIVSYGSVAALMGAPRAARAVGRALCTLPDDASVPWWRVVNRNGEISIKCSVHGPALQRALLEGEGIRFDRVGRIGWEIWGWDGQGIPTAPDLRSDPDAPAPIRALRRRRARRVAPDPR